MAIARACYQNAVIDFGRFRSLGIIRRTRANLYQLIAERYERDSLIITSNRDFDEWPSIFTNPLLGSAALDRLVHRGIQIVIEGSRYCLAEFKKACASANCKKIYV